MEKLSKVGLSELRDARHKLLTFRRAAFPINIKNSASQRAINKLLESDLTKAGFDSDKFGALIKWSDAEARLRIADLRAEADRQSPAVLDTLHRTVENLNDRLEHFKAITAPDAPAQYVLLDTATEISATSGISLDSTHIGHIPENNARFLYKASAGGEGFGSAGLEAVSFGFLWQNPSDSNAVVNVHGYIVLNGFCSVFSDGGFFGAAFSNLFVNVDLFIHELWNEPPTSPVGQPDQSQSALTLSVDSIGFLQAGGADGQSLFRGFDLAYSQFALPPKGIAMFEVSCSLGWWMHNGQTESDFSFGGRQLLSPGVLIAVLP